MKKTLRRFAALLLPVLLLLPLPAAAKNAPAGGAVLRMAVIADPHFYPDEMTGGFNEAYREDNATIGRSIEHAQTLFVSALAALKKRVKAEQIEFLLIPGDMTREGEYEGHARVARMLEKFERETGVQVAVVPGNHDVNMGLAADYSSGVRETARNLSPEEFLAMYGKLGYDLPGCERFEGTLSYAADLGKRYRLIAIDTNLHRLDGGEAYGEDDLRAWVVRQCEEARAAGRTPIGMGHHSLAEQIGGQEALMGNFSFRDVRGIGEDFADAGMHFYFSGHLHLSEIAMRVSDRGEPLYDICTASTAAFPGGYRTVKFSTARGKTEVDVRSHSVPLNAPPPYPQPYYGTLFGLTFGSADGDGLAGYVKAMARGGVMGILGNLGIDAPVKALGIDLAGFVDQFVDDALALPVSELPCTRFIGAYGFGDPDKPGTVEDLANSALVYLMGKTLDFADDPFLLDALRRMRSGELLDQLLDFAVSELLGSLGNGVLPLLDLAIGPSVREAMSASIYRFAVDVVTRRSPTGSPDGLLVYGGPVEVPTDPDTFRLPQDLSVAARGLACAEITWYTRQSACTPELIITDKDGNPAPEVKASISSQAEDVTAEQLDLGLVKLLGRTQPALKHTARLTGLTPGKTYRVTAGDGAWGWWGGESTIRNSRLIQNPPIR